MNHNPHNLKEGQHVLLDKDMANNSEVIILKFTPNQLFATVYGHAGETEEQWEVMTKRLSPKSNQTSNHNPYRFKPKDKVYIDATEKSKRIVEIKSMGFNDMFSVVIDVDGNWEVMTTKLSPIEVISEQAQGIDRAKKLGTLLDSLK